MIFNRHIFKNMDTTYRVELNSTGIWFQFGERRFSILWRNHDK